MLKGLSCGGLIVIGFRLIYKAIKALIIVIAYLLLYFGLWTVFLYMLLSTALWLWCGLDMAANDLNGILFKVGLLLSFIASLVLFFRNNLVKPINTIFEKRAEKREYENLRRDSKELSRLKSRRNKSDDDRYAYNDDYRNSDNQRRTAAREESPLIYRSAKDPSKIIHEYRNRFEIFTVIDGKLVFIDTRYK